jgi:hypothetical protein
VKKKSRAVDKDAYQNGLYPKLLGPALMSNLEEL